MPIDREEFENGEIHSKVEEEIISFLQERKERAFTSQEIMEGIRYHTEFSTPEIVKMSAFAVADFTTFLHHLVEKGEIRMKIVRGRMYFAAAPNGINRCPKCGEAIAAGKTWKMAGRPNKRGEKLQLHIGLFKCPKHGFFRAVIGRQKIPAQTIIEKSRRKKSLAKVTRKKKALKKKAGKKKTEAWILV